MATLTGCGLLSEKTTAQPFKYWRPRPVPVGPHPNATANKIQRSFPMTFMNGKNMLVLLIALMMFVPAGPGYGDEISDSIKEALEYYTSGDYTDAIESLNYAAQLIKQNKAETMESYLPKAPAGWTVESTDSQAAGAGMLGGGVTAERSYSNDSSRVTIQIITDSPVMQSVMMMFSNPMFAASEGGKLEKIGRQKAIVKHDPDARQGDIKIVVANRYFITVEGNQVDRETLIDFAKAIDFKKISDIP